ncbi:MAG TPA: hypothetical protein VID72_12520, partial [Ktedonobacterales bacterium]
MQLSSETQQRAAISGNLLPPERPNLWYRLSAPEPAAANDSLVARERNRRGRVASQIIGGELIALLLVAIDLPLARAVLPSLVLALVGCAMAMALNRQGHVEATGWLLALSIDAALIWPLLTAQGGLDPIYLPVYYLMVTAPLIAAATLTPATIMPITVVNCVFILVDIRLQPHTMMWNQMITSSSILYSMIVGPIALHVIVALLSYLWTRSATTALKRTDRAEEIGQWSDVKRSRAGAWSKACSRFWRRMCASPMATSQRVRQPTRIARSGRSAWRSTISSRAISGLRSKTDSVAWRQSRSGRRASPCACGRRARRPPGRRPWVAHSTRSSPTFGSSSPICRRPDLRDASPRQVLRHIPSIRSHYPISLRRTRHLRVTIAAGPLPMSR